MSPLLRAARILPRKAVVAALASASIAAGGLAVMPATAAGAATTAGPALAVPASGAYFGAASWNPTGNTGISDLEARTGRTMGVHRDYSMWDDVQPIAAVTDDIKDGRIPLLSIRPQLKNHTKISWQSIAQGSYDSAITAQATGLASLHKPVLLAFHHEADLQSGYGTAAQFRSAFRHYAQVVRAAGATNVSMVLVLSAYRYASNISDWYPGDDVVDWIGADAYNFASCSAGRPAWRTLAQTAGKFYTWGAARHKPLVLAEWGSAEDPALPGHKAQWIADAGATMKSWPDLKAAAYFDEPGSCNWRADTSATAWAAFDTLANSSWAQG